MKKLFTIFIAIFLISCGEKEEKNTGDNRPSIIEQ